MRLCGFPRRCKYAPLPLLTDELLTDLLALVSRIASRIERCPLSYRCLNALHEAVITLLRAFLPPEGRLILGPFGPLHLLPLAAARDPQTQRYAIDC